MFPVPLPRVSLLSDDHAAAHTYLASVHRYFHAKNDLVLALRST